MRVFRGEIYYVYLDPVFGHESGGYKTRPVAVISVDDINNKPSVITVIPGTSNTRNAGAPNLVLVKPTAKNGLKVDTVFECHQLRALDKGRFTGRVVGRLEPQYLAELETAIKVSLGIT